jgi:hypothetical protein
MKVREQGWLRLYLRVIYTLLCLLIVALALTSCRRQRSHAENLGTTEEETESRAVNPIILNAAQIYNNRPEHAFSNQLLIDISTTQATQNGISIYGKYLVTVRIVLPTNEEVVWKNLSVGARKLLTIEGAEYLIDVTEVDVDSARISITRKL